MIALPSIDDVAVELLETFRGDVIGAGVEDMLVPGIFLDGGISATATAERLAHFDGVRGFWGGEEGAALKQEFAEQVNALADGFVGSATFHCGHELDFPAGRLGDKLMLVVRLYFNPKLGMTISVSCCQTPESTPAVWVMVTRAM